MAMRGNVWAAGRANWLLAVFLGLSVVVRVAAAAYLGDQVIELPGTADQISYHTLALRVVEGHGFTFETDWWPATKAGAPTAHWSYLYTLYLALVYALFGPHPLVARLIQATVVGLLQPILTYWIARRLFGAPVGLAAAGLTTGYAYFIYYAATLMTEAFYYTLVVASLFLAMLVADAAKANEGDGKPGQTAPAPRFKVALLAVALGATTGLAVLLRQVLLLFVPIMFLWIWWASGRRRVWPLAIAGLVLAAMIAPATAFNYLRFNQFVLLNTNAGFALYWANHPAYGRDFVPILPSSTYYQLLPPELLHLGEAALDRALLKRGIQFALDDPVRYVLLCFDRVPAFFMFWPSRDSSLLSNLSRVASFGILWPLMLFGLVHSLFGKAHLPFNQIVSPAGLLLGFAVFYTLVHLLSWALIRYRLPVDAVLLVFAGRTVVDLANLLGKKRSRTPKQTLTSPALPRR
jgi:4-amino-4-deoxy-L-arabinose transferase-like glycosyltransferase